MFYPKEKITIGDFVHVYNRGNRKMPIVYDEADKWRFLRSIRFFNDENFSGHSFRDLDKLLKSDKIGRFERPKTWGPPKFLVKIIAYCLMPNHFHFLLKEIVEGGIAKFMQKFGTGFTAYTDVKYNETGRLFQGVYKRKIIKTEGTLQYVDAYIQVFNPFELYPGGLEKAVKEFDKAFDFVLEYPFCSLGESFNRRKLNIIDRDILGETFKNLQEYKEFASEAIVLHNIHKTLNREIALD
ncbi:MAG: transposase [Candidatus Marinimicrobia bacterium]|jgi:putative transposase|nr:transposase [Candidatus Neomarinimicrobiota bacterium]